MVDDDNDNEGYTISLGELNMVVIYMYIAPGQGRSTPWSQFLFINSIIQSMKSFVASFPH